MTDDTPRYRMSRQKIDYSWLLFSVLERIYSKKHSHIEDNNNSDYTK